MLVYKILRGAEWVALRQSGESVGAPIDVSDGFIHLSSAEQAPETAEKHFVGENGLFLLALDTDDLGDDLKWEESRGGAKFPHLYRKLALADVVWAQPLPLLNGQHSFPPGLSEAGR